MTRLNRIFAVSFIAMLAVPTVHAKVVTQTNIVGTNGVSVTVPTSGTNAGKVQISGPTVGNATLTVQRNGTTVDTFTANATSNKTINITDSDHITTATTSGSGNVVTAISADANGALTVTKGITALTSHQDISGKQNIQIGAAKSGSTASTDSGKAVVVDDNGKIAMSSATLKAVATSGSYNDLSNKPTIGNATLTVQRNGTTVDTFTANATSNKTINITDSDHITTATTSGSGNVVTAISADANGALTVTKGITALTSHQDISGKQNIQIGAAKSGSTASTDSGKVVVVDDNGKIAMSSATLKAVATSGSYNDLSNKPTIPTVNNKTLTIKQNGANAQTFTANSASDVTVDITAAKVGAVAAAQGSSAASKAVITNSSGNVTTGTIATGMITDGAVTTAKITDGNVTTAKIAGSAVTSAKIADGTIVNADIADGTIAKAKLASAVQTSLGKADTALQNLAATYDDTVSEDTKKATAASVYAAEEIAAGAAGASAATAAASALTQAKSYTDTEVAKKVTIAQGSSAANKAVITNSSGNVTTGTIATGMITDGAVTTAKITDANVTTAKIADSAVTSAKIANGTIVDADISTSAAIAQSKISGLTTALANAQNKIPSGSENSTTLASIWVE